MQRVYVCALLIFVATCTFAAFDTGVVARPGAPPVPRQMSPKEMLLTVGATTGGGCNFWRKGECDKIISCRLDAKCTKIGEYCNPVQVKVGGHPQFCDPNEILNPCYPTVGAVVLCYTTVACYCAPDGDGTICDGIGPAAQCDAISEVGDCYYEACPSP